MVVRSPDGVVIERRGLTGTLETMDTGITGTLVTGQSIGGFGTKGGTVSGRRLNRSKV
jgi:hypothetical protein